mmetsp:Transcript_92936/g.300413  ORF Transcript_92936/g.300413 Transcript_92936/m.300413 type:complete len:245 (-) Transcript_92936:391-1125(-)
MGGCGAFGGCLQRRIKVLLKRCGRCRRRGSGGGCTNGGPRGRSCGSRLSDDLLSGQHRVLARPIEFRQAPLQASEDAGLQHVAELVDGRTADEGHRLFHVLPAGWRHIIGVLAEAMQLRPGGAAMLLEVRAAGLGRASSAAPAAPVEGRQQLVLERAAHVLQHVHHQRVWPSERRIRPIVLHDQGAREESLQHLHWHRQIFRRTPVEDHLGTPRPATHHHHNRGLLHHDLLPSSSARRSTLHWR